MRSASSNQRRADGEPLQGDCDRQGLRRDVFPIRRVLLRYNRPRRKSRDSEALSIRHLAIRLLTVLVALPALAGDGRVEINQASVVEAGGFPYTINAPGSYVLTSDLIVSVDVTAISIATDDVTLDLNGFRIAGPHSAGNRKRTRIVSSKVCVTTNGWL